MRFINITISIILICLLSVVAVILIHFKTIQAASPIYEIAGWLWTENYGWISLNSENAELSDYPASTPYKVVVQDNQISGWGWSSNLGWICFGSTCDPNNICDDNPECSVAEALGGKFGSITPPGGWKADINPVSGRISGWAKVLALKDNGIIRFDSDISVSHNQTGEQCFNCKKKCIEWEQIPDPNDKEKTINGDCIKYSETEFDNCSFCFTKTYFGVKGEDGQAYPEGIPENEAVIGGSGNICFNCSENCQLQTSLVSGASRITCSLCSDCKYFGSAHDFSSGALVGWSWSSNNNQELTPNVGWIQMNTGWAGVVYPWLETQLGAVYSAKNIRQRSIVSGKNATYCIFAKDVYNFTSSQCQKAFYKDIDINYLSINNSANQIYKNALGKIDVKGLSTKVSGNYNKYGNEVVIYNPNININWSSPVLLSNKVYVINGNLTINNGFLIKNSGSGTVIINGDLLINGGFGYDTDLTGIKTIKDIGSIAWIVKGDVKVNLNVKQIAGAFIILGKDGVSLVKLSGSDENYPKFETNQYGIFSSGPSELPLTVLGLIVAKAFNWERSYSNIKQGSERAIYDGRLIANPPPGLKAFAEGLPIIRDFEF